MPTRMVMLGYLWVGAGVKHVREEKRKTTRKCQNTKLPTAYSSGGVKLEVVPQFSTQIICKREECY
jgi:hypothetical protein